MAITKAETLNTINIITSSTKVIRSTYVTTFIDDSTTPDTIAMTERSTAYIETDTIPAGENQMVKDIAAILFA